MKNIKNYKYGFIVLCFDHNISLINITIRSIKKTYINPEIICIADKSIKNEDLKELKKSCKSYRGKDTFSSLMNTGLKNAPADWNFFVMAGSCIRPRLPEKFFRFVESDKDILFPIANKKFNFIDGTLNGLFMHKKAYKEVGEFSSDNPLEICKLMWALDAIELGYKFKAIAGTKFC